MTILYDEVDGQWKVFDPDGDLVAIGYDEEDAYALAYQWESLEYQMRDEL